MDETGFISEDNLVLASCFLVYWITLFLLVRKSKNKTRTFVVNFLIHLAYSIYMLYGLAYRAEYGNGLAWWFYLIVFILLHWLINLGQLIWMLIKHRSK